MSLYPNPATEQINLQITACSHAKNMIIIDVTEKVVLQEQIQNQLNSITININSLESGYYIVKVSGNNWNKAIPFQKVN